jgi:hypothetical protein
MSWLPPVTDGFRSDAHGEEGPVTVGVEASPQGE